MNELIKQNRVKSDNTESVTFKISVSDKQKLIDDAAELRMTLSEYIRIKVLIEDTYLNKLILQNRELSKQVKESMVKLKVPYAGQVNETAILIQSTETGKKVIKQFLNEMKYRNNLLPRGDYDNDHDIACAFSVIIMETFAEMLEEFHGIRNKYKITRLEDFYRLLFKPYYDDVF